LRWRDSDELSAINISSIITYFLSRITGNATQIRGKTVPILRYLSTGDGNIGGSYPGSRVILRRKGMYNATVTGRVCKSYRFKSDLGASAIFPSCYSQYGIIQGNEMVYPADVIAELIAAVRLCQLSDPNVPFDRPSSSIPIRKHLNIQKLFGVSYMSARNIIFILTES